MGVPKFYRWISERYPCLSQVVKDHQVYLELEQVEMIDDIDLECCICDLY